MPIYRSEFCQAFACQLRHFDSNLMSEIGPTTCIIGAGYSYVGGLPLTKDLFSAPADAYSQEAAGRFKKVRSDYRQWRSQNPDVHDEKYPLNLYCNFFDRPAPPFEWAVEFIGATLAVPTDAYSGYLQPRYKYRVTQPSKCEAHKHFWNAVFQLHSDVSVVTTNYDILVERSLRHRPMESVFGPGFVYGGVRHPQVLIGTPQPFDQKNRQKEVELRGSVKLFKLHGSLNWSLDASGIHKLYQDLRPAFRHGGGARSSRHCRKSRIQSVLIRFGAMRKVVLPHPVDGSSVATRYRNMTRLYEV